VLAVILIVSIGMATRQKRAVSGGEPWIRFRAGLAGYFNQWPAAGGTNFLVPSIYHQPAATDVTCTVFVSGDLQT